MSKDTTITNAVDSYITSLKKEEENGKLLEDNLEKK